MKLKRVLLFFGVIAAGVLLFALCAVITTVTGVFDDDGAAPAARSSATATRRPSPTLPVSDEGALRVAVDEALGEGNRDMNNGRKLTHLNWRADEGTVEVIWAADDNFSSLIGPGIQNDTAAVLRAIHESGLPYERVFLSATFALVNEEGRNVEGEVLTASYDRAGIAQWARDGFPAVDVDDVAMAYWLSPVVDD